MEDLSKLVNDSDDKVNQILEILAADQLIRMFDNSLGIMSLLESNILTKRQIAKKILSYNVNPKLTDRELNLMLWGQDLQVVQGASYKPYYSETEDWVSYDGDYEPMDIRQMIKDQIDGIIIDVRRDLRNLESGILQLIKKVPVAVTQAITSITTVVAPQAQVPPVPMIVSNPTGAAGVALTLHNISTVLNTIIKDTLLALRCLTSLNELTTGTAKNIVAKVASPKILKPGINGAPPIKTMVMTTVKPTPNIHYLLPDPVLIILYKIVNPILDVLKILAEIVVVLDTAVLALDIVAMGPVKAVLIGLQKTLQVAIKSAASSVSNLSSVNSNSSEPPKATGNSSFASSVNDSSSAGVEVKNLQDELKKAQDDYDAFNTEAAKSSYITDFKSKNSNATDQDAINAYNNELNTKKHRVNEIQARLDAAKRKLPGGS